MTTTEKRSLSRLSTVDTAKVVANVLVPILVRGAVIRRPRAAAWAQRLDLDRRAVRLLTRLRERYGDAPLRLRLPGRDLVLPLDSSDAHEALARSPEPFSPASLEKRHALGQFQPEGLLISPAEQRAHRREFTEDVLATPHPVHPQAADFSAIVAQTVKPLLAQPELDWPAFTRQWWRLVRQVVLGTGAAGDDLLTDRLFALRRAGNWGWLHPRETKHREMFLRHLRGVIDRAQPGSLAARIAENHPGPDIHPESQVAHWLFAFDAAGIAVFRTLALLATHPEQETKALAESAGSTPDSFWELPYLRGCVQESLRLWPTTPLILRESTVDTTLGGHEIPQGATVILFAPYLHRNPAGFTPEIWQDGTAHFHGALVPFSDGPAVCPGRNLVLLLTTQVLATLRREHEIGLLTRAHLRPGRRLPSVLDHFALRFALTRRG
ncbi:cytochrome P450 [Crossiella sp. CA-258035]|uniref:cytochrome P450 n=1 Tax=Crossiella sp. CA-258035 TaxID=2981138 RepID=UPI0024BC19E2|nr:cytochrome P450 [Crossiella sp. CA-258035]WHT15921.1 cytochrome P450 [Crossiella sp. CA-258035]